MAPRRSTGAPARRSAPEAHIQAELVKILRGAGYLVHSIPNEAAASNAVRQGQLITMGLLPGVADLLAWSPLGVPVYIEVKSATGVQSPKQIKFQADIEALGVRYILARSALDIADLLG